MAIKKETGRGSYELLSGAYSAACGAMLSRAQVVAAYPITPQSTIVERLSEYIAEGKLEAKFIPVESEHSALAVLASASAGGVRTFTATARQGLALMHEVLHWAGRGRCPIVMAVVTATLGPPPDIGMEQDDALVQRDTGWMQFYCQSNQEILDTIIQAYRVAELVSVPVMVCFDGFIMSHTYEPVFVPDREVVDGFLPPRQTKFKIDPDNPLRFFASPGAVAGAGYLSKLRRRTQDALEVAPEVVKEVHEEFYQHFGRRYGLIECYRAEDAEVILVAMTSVASMAHDIVDELRKEGKKVGLLRVRMFRPFPRQEIIAVLQNAAKVAVIDRNISYGRSGILALELRAAMYSAPKKPPIFGFIGGVAGLSITPGRIREAIEYTYEHPEPDDEVIWLGIPRWEE
ncbi:MAG: transketolase C-terminal domain-containing protein [Desulfatiglandales bacterium]